MNFDTWELFMQAFALFYGFRKMIFKVGAHFILYEYKNKEEKIYNLSFAHLAKTDSFRGFAKYYGLNIDSFDSFLSSFGNLYQQYRLEGNI